MFFLFYLIITVFNKTSSDEQNKKSLIFSSIVFRHGARSPYNYENNSTLTDKVGNKWNIPKSELTIVGKRMSYLLGYKYRLKYKNFLNSKYDIGEVYAVSTNRSRTTLTLQSFIQGLYSSDQSLDSNKQDDAFPQKGDIDDKFIKQIKNKSKELNEKNYAIANNIATIPTFMINSISDPYQMLYESCKNYPPYNATVNKRMIFALNNFIKSSENEIKNIFKIDIEEKDLVKLNLNLYELADSFIANYYEKTNTINNLFKNNKDNIKKFYLECEKFTYEEYTYGVLGEEDAYLSRMSSSKYFEILLDYINRRIIINSKNDDKTKSLYNYSDPKLYLFSGHDVNISLILNYLFYSLNEKKSGLLTPFNSNISFELYYINNSKDNYLIEIYYNDKLLYSLTFKEFEQKIRKASFSKEDIDDFCDNNNIFVQKNSKILIIVITTMSIVIVLLSISLIYLWYSKKKTSNKEINMLI